MFGVCVRPADRPPPVARVTSDAAGVSYDNRPGEFNDRARNVATTCTAITVAHDESPESVLYAVAVRLTTLYVEFTGVHGTL